MRPFDSPDDPRFAVHSDAAMASRSGLGMGSGGRKREAIRANASLVREVGHAVPKPPMVRIGKGGGAVRRVTALAVDPHGTLKCRSGGLPTPGFRTVAW